MDIRITSSGRVFYRVDPTLAALLLELLPAAVERVNENPAPAAPVPQWGIGKDAGDYPHIFYKQGGQVSRYSGPPDQAASGFKVRVWSGEKQAHVFEGPEPPPEIIEQYRQKYGTTGTPPAVFPATYHAMMHQEPGDIK